MTKRRPSAFNRLRVGDADARRKDMPEKVRVERLTERAPRQFGDGDIDRMFGKRRSRSAEPQAITAGASVEARPYVQKIMVEERSGVGRKGRSVRSTCFGFAAVDINPPDASPPLHVPRQRKRREIAEPQRQDGQD